MKARRTYAYGIFAAILVLAVTTAGCNTATNPIRPEGDSLYDFQEFLAGLQLGNIANDGAWPIWNTGQPGVPNHLSVVAEPGDGRALRVPFGGAHGVDILLTGANSLGVAQGDWLEIHGRIVVIATGAPAATQLAAIRSAGGYHPSHNLVQVPIRATSPEFVISRVIAAADLAQPAPGAFPAGPSLRLVNEPSNPGTVMYVTDILVLR